MEIRQLNTFAAIARLGSFTQAAEMLGYAQSSITTQIQLLESELDTKLFERIGKSIALTPDGEKLLPYAQKILKLSEEAKNIIVSSDTPKGTLTIGAPESLCVMRLPGIFKEYHTCYPDVELILKFGTCAEFRRFLRENVIDVAVLLENRITDSDLVTELQFPEPMAVLTAPCHPFADRDCVYPEDLADQSLILTENGCSYRAVFDNILAKSGVRPRSILETGSVQAIKQLTADGLGVSLLPRIAVEDEVRQGRLSILNWKGPDFGMMTQVVYHKDKWISAPLRIFLDLVKKIKPLD